ncbi:MAG: LysM peptidoglycan-binding domain-containing protein [Phycisphaerales bacterium]|nr:LysM peptidoglycan-binding domain-containing protein [Phycisphaerales bacterium]
MSGPTRLGLAIAALIAVWSIVFWVTPSVQRGPKVTFGSAPEAAQDNAVPIVDPIDPVIDEDAGAPPTPEPLTDPTAQVSAQPRPAQVEPPSFFLYVLTAGDTPETISERFYKSNAHWSAIARANPEIDFGKPLPVGRVIRVPVEPTNVQGRALGAAEQDQGTPPTGAFEYTVQQGDTLGAVALRFYGDVTKWPLIRDANADKINRQGTNIKPGMKLIIPKP